ncbi:MAG: hypothetical protein AAF004_02380 [Pseudomonadota bacterium]
MSTRFVVPDGEAVGELLSIVLGDGTSAADASVTDFSGYYAASYIDDDDKLVAVGICNTPFVFYSGAALSTIPAGAASDMMAEGEPSDSIFDNFYEVMNICSRLLMTEQDEHHLRVAKTFKPAEAASVISEITDGVTKCFNLAIPSYGEGEMHFIVT